MNWTLLKNLIIKKGQIHIKAENHELIAYKY